MATPGNTTITRTLSSGAAFVDIDVGAPLTYAYLHVENRAERLMRLSGQVADEALRLGMDGTSDESVSDLAECADELATMARFVDPNVGAESIHYTLSRWNSAEPFA